jgi:hypothetical protein
MKPASALFTRMRMYLKATKTAFAFSTGLFLLLLSSLHVSAQNETLSTGSYIINMGVVPQTRANALKPYGLVYDLLKTYHVPVKWVISQTKIKDGADFTYNSVDYKGGTFIIPAEYMTATVNSRISFFGVTGTTTTSPLTVNVTYTLSSAPRWTLDDQNGNIAAGFFTDAGIPVTAYNSKTPGQLDGCDDIYVMPHADADWSYYGPLLDWVNNNHGSFWGGCRTGSQIENLYNPSNPSQQMNFLSLNVGSAGNALIPFNSHHNGSDPFTHQFPTSPVAQYMGITDGAQGNGSEQIYLPVLSGNWRPTTQLISYDPTQQDVPAISPGLAATIAFGRIFGDNTKGYAMYEGGHDIGGTNTDQIAAQRVFWNFSLLASIGSTPVISAVTAPDIVRSGIAYSISVAASSPNGAALTYQWSSSCGGTFSNPTGQTTNYTAPIVTTITTCAITCTVTDACGRSSFKTKFIQVLPPVTNPDFNTTWVNVPVPGNVSTNDLVPAGTTYGTAPALLSSPAGSSPSITMNSDGTYSFVSNIPGVYTYDVPVCVPGQSAPCPPTKLVITVLAAYVNTNAPVANVDVATANVNTPVTLATLANDAAGNIANALVPSTVTVTVSPLHGSAVANSATGDITYTPALNYTGFDTLTYSVCDNQVPSKCATAKQIITINAQGIANTTAAADDYKITNFNTPATGNVKPNDTDAEGNTQTVAPQTTTVPGKGTLVLTSDGNYTFTPVVGYFGPADFPYNTCDNGTPQACASATLHILVRPEQPLVYPDFNVTYVNVPVPGNVNTNDKVPAGTTYGSSPALVSSPAGSSPSITMNSDGTYSFVSDIPGVYIYNVPVCVPNQTAPCPPSLLTITVLGPTLNTNPPVANTDIASTKINTPVTLISLINDKAGNAGGSLNPASVVVTISPLHGTASPDPATGNMTYTPANGYTGTDTLTYQVCDNNSPVALCATAKQIITIKPAGITNTTLAADDYNSTIINTPVSGNVKTNDIDPEGNAQTVTAQTTTVTGKGTLVLGTDGNYTFTPQAGFTGAVNFPYTTCDDGTPQACANATLYILVGPLPQLPDLTPSIFNDGTTLVQNTTRDNVIRIFNIGTGPTKAPVIFTIPKMQPAFIITINPAETSMDVFGGITLSNADWTIVEQASRYVITSKPGIIIAAGGFADLGVKVKAAGIRTSTANLSVQVVFGTGGGETPINNNSDNNTYSVN